MENANTVNLMDFCDTDLIEYLKTNCVYFRMKKDKRNDDIKWKTIEEKESVDPSGGGGRLVSFDSDRKGSSDIFQASTANYHTRSLTTRVYAQIVQYKYTDKQLNAAKGQNQCHGFGDRFLAYSTLQ